MDPKLHQQYLRSSGYGSNLAASTDEWIKMIREYLPDGILVIKMNEVHHLQQCEWTYEGIMLSETSQRQILHYRLYVKSKNETYKSIYKTKTDLQVREQTS